MTTAVLGLTDSRAFPRRHQTALGAHDRNRHRHSDQRNQVVCDYRNLVAVGEGEVAAQALVGEDCEIRTYRINWLQATPSSPERTDSLS